MTKVGVRLPPLTGSAGEYLADASALEAAGADAIWLEMGGLDAWVVLGALAAATQRVRLGCILAPGAFHDADRQIAGVAAGQKLSRGRIVLAVPGNDLADNTPAGAKVFSLGAAQASVDGVIHQLRSPRDLPSRTATHIEVWGDIAMPADREAWAATMSAYEAAGLTGVIVHWDTRLVDLMRNTEPDDRSDLLMSTG
ncbi:MAG: LLM class flavin-dependent oxidoreductase [Candidatus Dormiibacterota bacterium]